MNLKFLLLLPVCLAVAGCDQHDKTRSNTNPNVENADNTGINVRDRDSDLPVAGDQSESEADRAITQKVRQAIIKDSALSTNAKNIKIITIRGVVTLRGPVNNENEKAAIEKKAHSVEGVDQVVNRIEIVR